MESTIKQVSLGEDFLVDIGKSVSFFRFKGIPEDLHLSISHDPDHRDLDFHITRNTSGEKKKPKIIIFKVDKIIAEVAINQFGQELFHFLYKPLPFPYRQRLSRKHFLKRVRFFSLAENQNKKFWAKTKYNLKEILDKTSVIKKKKKLKIAPSFLEMSNEWAKNNGSRALTSHDFKSLTWNFNAKPENGLLVSPGFTGFVIISNGQYFIQRDDIDLRRFADLFWGVETTNKIVFKTLLAIKRVGKADSYEQVSLYDRPIRLMV